MTISNKSCFLRGFPNNSNPTLLLVGQNALSNGQAGHFIKINSISFPTCSLTTHNLQFQASKCFSSSPCFCLSDMGRLLDEKSSLYIDNNNSALEEERSEKELGDDEEDYEEGFGNDGYCGWSGFLCLRRQRYYKIESVSLLQAQGEIRENLWRRKLKEVKEITELLCGPKWKNLIRKISVYANNIKGNKRRRVQFQYDPHSYALNFDHGEEDDASRLDFISRFAPLCKINSG